MYEKGKPKEVEVDKSSFTHKQCISSTQEVCIRIHFFDVLLPAKKENCEML